MANNNNIPRKNYEQLKEELLKKVSEQKEFNNKCDIEIRLLIRDMVAVLRTTEKKERAAVTQQIKNDFLSVLGKTTIYKLLKEIYEEGLEKPEKQKIAIGADGSQILEGDESGTGGTGGGDDNSDDIYSQRQKSKNDRETRTIKKGSATMQKIKPPLTGVSELETGEEEEEEEEEQEQQDQEEFTDETEKITALRDFNNIVIDDVDHLRDIADLIKQGKAVIVVVNRSLVPDHIKAGKSLSE